MRIGTFSKLILSDKSQREKIEYVSPKSYYIFIIIKTGKRILKINDNKKIYVTKYPMLFTIANKLFLPMHISAGKAD